MGGEHVGLGRVEGVLGQAAAGGAAGGGQENGRPAPRPQRRITGGRMICGNGWMRRCGAMLWMIAGLTSGSETEAAICRDLRAAPPTWSTRDTERSKEEGARFVAVFETACEKG
jgi:hypothetical protein